MTMAYDAAAGVLTVRGIDVEGSVAGIASVATPLSVTTDELVVDTAASSVNVAALFVEALEMTIRADVEPFTYDGRITPRANVEIDAFSPRKLMALFDVEPPATADPIVLGRATLKARAQLNETAIAMTGVRVELDDTIFTGSLSVPRGAGAYRFELAGDRLDLARYMAPADESAAAGGGDDAPVEIPLDLIRSLEAEGKATLQRATLGAMVFEEISVGLKVADDALRLAPMSAALFGGRYNGDVRIAAERESAVLSVDERIEGVDMAALAKAMFDQDNVTGTINGAFKLSGRGADLAAIQRSLAGNMSFTLADGSYEGTDLWYELRRARALLKGEEPPEPSLPARTEFSSVAATGVVTDGVMRNDDLRAELPYMQLSGAGDVDLATATVDYDLSARILERPEFLSDATEEELEQFTEAVIPLKITGPLASPSVKPDVEKLLRQRVEEELKDKLKDKLGDKLGDLLGQ